VRVVEEPNEIAAEYDPELSEPLPDTVTPPPLAEIVVVPV
jgi:hypothetical protein